MESGLFCFAYCLWNCGVFAQFFFSAAFSGHFVFVINLGLQLGTFSVFADSLGAHSVVSSQNRP